MKNLVRKIMAIEDGPVNNVTARQGKVTAVTAGNPTKVSVDMGGGTTLTNIVCMSHVMPVIGQGVWIMAMKKGRWIVVGTSGTRDMGFQVRRITTNDTPIASGGSGDITWNFVTSDTTWSTFTGFTSGSALTVPADGAGLYVLSTHVYMGAALANVFCVITNNNLAISGQPESAAGQSRLTANAIGRLAPGDLLRVHIVNISASTLTPTIFAGDINTPPGPFLKCWRIS